MSINKHCSDSILLGFVGDLHVDRESPADAFDNVRAMLQAPDIMFGNLSTPCSDNPVRPPVAFPVISSSKTLDVYSSVGFNVVGMANNHILDAGHQAMLDNRSRLNEAGVATCGAGENLSDARRPAIVTAGARRIGFLAYSSVFPIGSEAQSDRPGLAPLRAYNRYRDISPNYNWPGVLPLVETEPDPTDHQNLCDDIAALRPEVDTLVVSVHWGDNLRPHVLTDHELRTAHLCIDQGADIVVGHYHHMLRGIEWYKQKPIFYGLGHFVLDLRWKLRGELKSELEEMARRDPDSFWIFPRDGWPLLPMHPDTRMTMMGWAMIKENRIVDIGFIPCRLREDGRVFAVDPKSTEGREIVDYLSKGNRRHSLNGKPQLSGAPLVGGCATVRMVPLDPAGGG
jgi:poly-gamma-glutamate capsule biosynthesis protein CapA/YwtB (metallophosphatase superfamily)